MTEDVSSKEILLLGEVIKLVISIWFVMYDDSPTSAQGQGVEKLIWLLRHSYKMLVLAGIYAAMNILSFVAFAGIGAGEFTVCAQLKVLTTAGFSVIVLGTNLSGAKWRALGLLVLGCILVASPSLSNHNGQEKGLSLVAMGYTAVLTEVCLSGFASIYFEKIVKSTTEIITIWERNFQLSVYSIIMYTLFILFEGSSRSNDGTQRIAWSNWSYLTLLVSLLGAGGGILVAATLKYADAILKTLATAGSIVISTVLGHFFLDGPLDIIMCIGSCTVIVSIFNYTMDTSGKPNVGTSSQNMNMKNSNLDLSSDSQGKGTKEDV